MEMLPVKPERKAQLDDYALRHGQDTAAAPDEVLANYPEWEQRDYRESLAAIRKGYEDVKAGLSKKRRARRGKCRCRYLSLRKTKWTPDLKPCSSADAHSLDRSRCGRFTG